MVWTVNEITKQLLRLYTSYSMQFIITFAFYSFPFYELH